MTYPIQLNAAQEMAAKEWAADDRLWTTQETVQFNLRTFARVILKAVEADRATLQAEIETLKEQIRQLKVGIAEANARALARPSTPEDYGPTVAPRRGK